MVPESPEIKENGLPSNVRPFRRKQRNLNSDLRSKDPFMDRVAHLIKTSFDVPIISPVGIIALDVNDEGVFQLIILPPDSYTPSKVILSMDQVYSLIHSLDYVLNGK